MAVGDIIISRATLTSGQIGRILSIGNEDTLVLWEHGGKSCIDDKMYRNVTDILNVLGYTRSGDYEQGWNAALEKMREKLKDLEL